MKHLLIIDDDPVSVLILKKMLVNAGFLENPIVFYNGSDALAFFLQSNTTNEIYYVFLDINMPEMNGWEFLDHMQTIIKPINFKVYLLTSSTSEQEKRKSEEYKCILQFISKPISKENILQVKEEFFTF